MKTIFADFQSKGVNEFVLDLRYNGGGYEHSANMLAGLLISEEYKDKVFWYFFQQQRESDTHQIFQYGNWRNDRLFEA